MRKLTYMVVGLATVAAIFTGCKKGFLEGINENPNLPTEVTPPILLPAGQASIAYTQGGDIERYTSVFMNYVTGASRQFFAFENYTFTEEDFNNLWNNIYAGGMKDLDNIIDIAADQPGAYTAYAAIAKITLVHGMDLTTDGFGDVPFSDAFKGNESPTPAYDTQEEVYAMMFQYLQEAIDSLSNDPGDDFAYPGNDDAVYFGDLEKWIAFGHALQARLYIHLSDMDVSNATNALNAIAAGALTSSADDAAFNGFSSTGPGPWYQYIEQRDDIGYYGEFLDQLAADGDPRYPVYVDTVEATAYWAVGYLGSYYSADASPVYFMQYFEQKFIEAEALNRTGDSPGAETALRDAITANMETLGIDGAEISTYVDAVAGVGTTGTGETQLELIMDEKYKAMFLKAEAWTDWRRTGYPAELSSNVPGLEIPVRFIYPTNENIYNAANIPTTNSSLYTPVLWWDN